MPNQVHKIDKTIVIQCKYGWKVVCRPLKSGRLYYKVMRPDGTIDYTGEYNQGVAGVRAYFQREALKRAKRAAINGVPGKAKSTNWREQYAAPINTSMYRKQVGS